MAPNIQMPKIGLQLLSPEDFEKFFLEFWSYIDKKLNPFIDKISVIYSCDPSSIKNTEKGIDFILRKFKSSPEFYSIDDSLLTAEAASWIELIKDSDNKAALDLLEENMRDINTHAYEVINQTLRDTGIGVLFIPPDRKLSLSEDIKVVKMCPFDPVDYLNRHLAILKLLRK